MDCKPFVLFVLTVRGVEVCCVPGGGKKKSCGFTGCSLASRVRCRDGGDNEYGNCLYHSLGEYSSFGRKVRSQSVHQLHDFSAIGESRKVNLNRCDTEYITRHPLSQLDLRFVPLPVRPTREIKPFPALHFSRNLQKHA